MTPRAFLCDFDGTVSPADIGAALVERFSPGRSAERDVLLARWSAGILGHRALTEAECALVRVDQGAALEFVRGFALDPHFAPFARAALARGDAVMVVSEGFGFYVRDLLARAGLAALPAAANEARFEGGRMIPDFPWSGDGCGNCGNCKAQHVRHWRARGHEVVLVGDGLSDRCGAEAADRVFARGSLLEWCRARGRVATPFRDFSDVARMAWDGAARAPARSGP